MRELSSNRVVFESYASNDGPWLDDNRGLSRPCSRPRFRVSPSRRPGRAGWTSRSAANSSLRKWLLHGGGYPYNEIAMEATRIIAVRHGETAWNVDARIQGQLDVGLNDTGRWQARRVGEALAGEQISAVYSSDLGRAHQTAQSIAEVTGVAVVPEEGLRERSFGIFEGKTFDEIHETWPDHAHNWRKRIPEWEPPEGGESLIQLRERVTRTLQSLAARHPGEQIVVVAHGGVLDAIYRVATGQEVNSPRTWELPNGAINRLLWTPEGFTLVGWSDTQHLDPDTLDDDPV